MKLHPTAIVDPRADLAADVEIGPYCIVGAGVVLGEGTRLVAHVVVEGPTTIGRWNVVHPFAVIGGTPQHKRAPTEGAHQAAVIGDSNVIREHVTVHRGTGHGGGGVTRVGSSNLLMVGCHVAHDVVVGSHVTVANGVQLAGHAHIEDHATFGGLSGVAQFVRVGESAFVAAGAMCEKDVPPFVIVQGDRARVRALNEVGLRRRGAPEASIAALQRAYRALFVSTRPRAEALRDIPRDDPFVARLLEALAPPRVP